MSPLRLKGVTKRYGDTAVVDDLSLEIAPGRCHGLLGPNGAGKTTTLRLALGLIEADAGEIRLLGHRMPHEAAAARARVGVVPQTDSLDPDFTVRENLLTYGRYFGLGHRDAESRIPALLEFAGLTGKSEAKVPTLSGGMKRRLTLARALVNDPELVVLDEPTTGLDPQARHLVWQGLRRLIHQGKTLLLTTHFMDEAERLCDRISIIDHGRIIAEGSPRELITRHIEPHVVEVYGAGLANWEDGTGKSFDGPPQERLGPLGGRAAPPAWASDLAFLCRRCEHAGETLFCYTDDPKAVIDALDRRTDLRYLHRPANLEDVFLKLTGRDLRD